MKKIILIILCLSLISSFSFAKNKEELVVPKNIKIISQSSDMDQTYITVIDLDNNEVVILVYSGTVGLNNVIRTGAFVNPKDQLSFSGKDSPIQPRS